MPHKCPAHYGHQNDIFEHKVSNLIGISVSTINRQVEKGTFPPKHQLSPKRIGFLKYQIDQWIDGKRNDW